MATQMDFQTLKSKLEKKNQMIRKQIHDLEVACDFEEVNTIYGATSYRHLLLRRMPMKFYRNVFGIYRAQIIPEITATLEPYILQKLYTHMEAHGMAVSEQYMVMYCKEYKQTSLGKVLTLADPYGERITYAMTDCPYSKNDLRDRLVRVKAQILLHDKSEYINIISMELMPYRLHERLSMIISEGKEETWLKIRETDYSEFLSNLKEHISFTDNMEEVISFIEYKKANCESYGHADRNFIKKNGYAFGQDRHNKYVLIPRNGRIDAIVYEGQDLADVNIWAYKSFLMEDDRMNQPDRLDLELIQSY